MKKQIILLLFICIICFNVNAQSKRVGFNEYFERAYPWYNFTFTMGTGVFPYGLAFKNELNTNSDYEFFNGVDGAGLFGLSYSFYKINFGFFVEYSLLSQFVVSGNNVLPFPKSQLNMPTSTRITNVGGLSNSLNTGVMYGGRVFEGFEMFFKLGFGPSWHEYYAIYDDFVTNETSLIKEGFAKSYNYQTAIDFRYFPGEVFGFTASLGISQNFPVFSISSAWKFGYKARKQKDGE